MSRTYKTGESAEKLLLKEDQAVYNARAKDALPKLRTVFKLIDLFCGAGGMTLGFTEDLGHHFKSVWANDFNKYSVDTYTANFGSHCLPGDLVDILKDPSVTIPRADVVIGGPSCRDCGVDWCVSWCTDYQAPKISSFVIAP